LANRRVADKPPGAGVGCPKGPSNYYPLSIWLIMAATFTSKKNLKEMETDIQFEGDLTLSFSDFDLVLRLASPLALHVLFQGHFSGNPQRR
jgi:hypothetical protein